MFPLASVPSWVRGVLIPAFECPDWGWGAEEKRDREEGGKWSEDEVGAGVRKTDRGSAERGRRAEQRGWTDRAVWAAEGGWIPTEDLGAGTVNFTW